MEDSKHEELKKEGFFKYVFNFDEESKCSILNLLQFSILSCIPIIILNKCMQRFVPEADDQKSSIELSFEILVQIIVMFLGLFFINRIVNFIPTYSESKYPECSVIFTVLPILLITLSLQTKLGEKVSILCDRIYNTWEGDNKSKKAKKNKEDNGVRISQPLSDFNMSSSMGTTSISNLPVQNQQQQQQQQYQQQQDEMPIMAANEFLGGNGGFGAMF